MELKPGARLVSQVCTTEIVVVRAPEGAIDLRCGGSPMTVAGGQADALQLSPEHASGTLLGKRYGDEEAGILVLCVKPGDGSLSLGDAILARAEARPLPSSD